MKVMLSGDHTIRLQEKVTAKAAPDERADLFSFLRIFSDDLVVNEAQRYFICKCLR